MRKVYYILGALVLLGAMVVPQTAEAFAYWTVFMGGLIYGLYRLREYHG